MHVFIKPEKQTKMVGGKTSYSKVRKGRGSDPAFFLGEALLLFFFVSVKKLVGLIVVSVVSPW